METLKNLLFGMAIALVLFLLLLVKNIHATEVDAALRLAEYTKGIPKNVLRAICTVESGLDKNALKLKDGKHTSYGLCQIQYETAVFVRYGGDAQGLMNVYTNAIYSAEFLRFQYRRYGNWYDAIAAYNAGKASKDRFGSYYNAIYVQEVMKLCRDYRCPLSK